MARLHINIPETGPKTVLHIPVRITDINYGQHLGNDSLVGIIHEARVQFLQQHGFTELQAGGTSLIMKDIAVTFEHESFYGDELTVDIYCGEISKVSFQLIYEMTVIRDGRDILIAKAKTTMVCFNYDTRRISAMPDSLRDILQ